MCPRSARARLSRRIAGMPRIKKNVETKRRIWCHYSIVYYLCHSIEPRQNRLLSRWKIVIFANFLLTPYFDWVIVITFDSASSLFRPHCFASCGQWGFFAGRAGLLPRYRHCPNCFCARVLRRRLASRVCFSRFWLRTSDIMETPRD